MKTTVLGIGNILLTDEGVGIHVVQELSKNRLPEEVEVLDGGTLGFDLINVVCETDRLIIVDAVRAGGEPGTIYHFKIEDFDKLPSCFLSSLHEIGIIEVLSVAELLGKKPKTEIFGIEPKSIEVGTELSREVKEKVPRLIEMLMKRLKEN